MAAAEEPISDGPSMRSARRLEQPLIRRGLAKLGPAVFIRSESMPSVSVGAQGISTLFDVQPITELNHLLKKEYARPGC